MEEVHRKREEIQLGIKINNAGYVDPIYPNTDIYSSHESSQQLYFMHIT